MAHNSKGLLLLEDKVDSNTKRIDELFNKYSNKEEITMFVYNLKVTIKDTK